MKIELTIIPESAMELLHIAARLRDQESSDNDSIPFMPKSPNIYESPGVWVLGSVATMGLR